MAYNRDPQIRSTHSTGSNRRCPRDHWRASALEGARHSMGRVGSPDAGARLLHMGRGLRRGMGCDTPFLHQE